MYEHKLKVNIFSLIFLKFFEIALYIEDDEAKVKYTKDMCSQIAQHMVHVRYLPPQCMKYDDIVKDLKSHEKDRSHPTSWMV